MGQRGGIREGHRSEHPGSDGRCEVLLRPNASAVVCQGDAAGLIDVERAEMQLVVIVCGLICFAEEW